MAIPKQASVVRLVVLALARARADNVSQLARDIGAPRASVSRALHRLAKDGLATHEDGWSLTAAGTAEAQRLASEARGVRESTSRSAARRVSYGLRLDALVDELARSPALALAQSAALDVMTSVQRSPAFAMADAAAANSALQMYRALERSPAFAMADAAAANSALQMYRALERSPAFAVADAEGLRALGTADRILASQFAQTFESIDLDPIYPRLEEAIAGVRMSTDVSKLVDAMSLGVGAALDVQRLFADAGRALDSVSRFTAGPIASLAADLDAIGDSLLSRQLPHPMLSDLGLSAIQVVGSYRDAIPDLTAASDEATGPASLGSSSLTTSSYVTGTRQIVEGHRGTMAEGSGEPEAHRLLLAYDRRLARIRSGAWHAIEVAGPDWQRHAAHSGRELLRQVLEGLAPNDAVAARYGTVTRKNRIRYMLGDAGESRQQWAEAVAESLAQTLDFLSAEAKNAGDPRFGLVGATGILMSLDGFVVFLVGEAAGETQ